MSYNRRQEDKKRRDTKHKKGGSRDIKNTSKHDISDIYDDDDYNKHDKRYK
jgi:hypothetical protein